MSGCPSRSADRKATFHNRHETFRDKIVLINHVKKCIGVGTNTNQYGNQRRFKENVFNSCNARKCNRTCPSLDRQAAARTSRGAVTCLSSKRVEYFLICQHWTKQGKVLPVNVRVTFSCIRYTRPSSVSVMVEQIL